MLLQQDFGEITSMSESNLKITLYILLWNSYAFPNQYSKEININYEIACHILWNRRLLASVLCTIKIVTVYIKQYGSTI